MKNFYVLIGFIGITWGMYPQQQQQQSVEGNVNNLPVREYNITIDQEEVKIGGKEKMGMTINGSIPGPTLRFTQGEYAVIHVKNEMDVETSVHWHGLLLPNFFDGVPYLTTPPIEPGETFTYEFSLKQAGTYWYHSHTALQEQNGVYGSIVIEDPEEDLDYDSDLVLVLADWTFEKPKNVLKTLKRGNEWYGIKKNTVTPLNRVIARGALGAQLNFWKQRMEGMDVSDVYYPAFITNGAESREYPEFKPGERVRLRFINAAASTQFWLTFGGEDDPILVAADGLDVVPVQKNNTFIAVAETYDFIVTIPESGKLEVRASAQDGTGQTSAFLGQGQVLTAPSVPKPDLIGMMKQMAAMDMRMGAPAMKFNPDKETPYETAEKYGMQMNGMEGMEHGKMEMDHEEMNQNVHEMDEMKKSTDTMMMDHGNMDGKEMIKAGMVEKGKVEMDHEMGMQGGMFSEYNYDYLKAPVETDFSEDKPVKEILLNLTGNMERYIWSLNGVPLSEGDKIRIKQGEVTRITLNNLTMMHHPMHLHGHFFRVINEHGEYSPLKHTVNVAPMQKVVIEFDANEYGDWFFHCHILYHLDSGMARIFSYDTPRDERLEDHPLKILTNTSNHYFTWGIADVASHMTGLTVVSSNIRNQFTLTGEYGWNQNMEAEFTYERYLNDWFRVFGGINVENEGANSLDEIATTAIAGIRYFTPYMFNFDVRLDNKLRPQLSLSREILVFRRIAVFAEYEFQADFGWVNDLSEGENFEKEEVLTVGAEYFLAKNFSIMGSYDNRFGAGGGLSIRF
ncbi:multicopper oxidase domain-containing protein [Salinimicrobium oceani]|uniref:Multicopper oxidase domain-containing protein n=1 Tax=Salinimicrobium oceani TaxID=2722702 RepID=A0ABX1CWN1_9FLAO|nr:multicopper oxidase domain-containing protein [Salinimicrobium oceani]NJW52677.1 multicopper oxidase domain-containing protein [Salinimicrobium oceani]